MVPEVAAQSGGPVILSASEESLHLSFADTRKCRDSSIALRMTGASRRLTTYALCKRLVCGMLGCLS